MAVAAAAYGVKKGIDAQKDFEKAKDLNEEAEELYEWAKQRLNQKREKTNKILEELGQLKVDIYQGSLKEFVNIFSKIKNVDFEEKIFLDDIDLSFTRQNIVSIQNSVLRIEEALGGIVVSLGGGALAGIGALGGVSTLATASTGTAIASLSGAAATNATLAWLGGGSLAAGGFGMAGGMVVLGGIVTGPALAIGESLLASKAESAKYTAKSNLRKAKAAAEQMDSAVVVLDGIYKRAKQFIYILNSLNPVLKDLIADMKKVTNKLNNWNSFTEKEKKRVMIAVATAETIKNLCDTPLIDKDGNITKQSKKVLKISREFFNKIENM